MSDRPVSRVVRSAGLARILLVGFARLRFVSLARGTVPHFAQIFLGLFSLSFKARTVAFGAVRTTIVEAVRVFIAVVLVIAGSPAGSKGQAGPTRYIERDSIRVIYVEGDERAAERTLQAALAPLPLPGIPEAAVLPKSNIFLAPDEAAFDSAALGRPPAWAAAVAIPSQRMIVLPMYARGPFSDPVVTLRHELAHLALNGYIGGPVPRWFDEGYATWVSGEWDERSGWQIRLALLTGQAPVLDSLTLAWPQGEPRARLAYLLSASAVRHLATSRGERAFAAFLAEWRRSGSFDDAMRSVYQMTLTQYEREWRGMVRRRYGWLLALTQATILWVGAAILVFVLSMLRRKRNRERLEELRREEYMLPPADIDSEYQEWSDSATAQEPAGPVGREELPTRGTGEEEIADRGAGERERPDLAAAESDSGAALIDRPTELGAPGGELPDSEEGRSREDAGSRRPHERRSPEID